MHRCGSTRRAIAFMACLTMAAGLCLVWPAAAEAQERERSAGDVLPEGAFPDATFDAAFRKYTLANSTFSPFYSWDARMALNLTVVRQGSRAVGISSMFQTVGTENLGSKVGVGGTGYLLGLAYTHTRSARLRFSSGLVHFSSHLTRDLDDKIDEEHAKGHAIPLVDDPSEFNVIYFKGTWKPGGAQWAPEMELVVQPINFRFNHSQPDYVRPIYFGTRWTLWQGDRKSLIAETQQEFGENPFTNVALVFALFARNQPEGRFQIFLSGAPGANVHVSPQTGALRDGIAFGIRLNLRA